MKRILPILCAVGAWAQSGIEVPSIGAIVDPGGALRPVQGVAGSFLLGPAAASGVLSAACSERLCLAKTDSEVISTTGRTDAPKGPAIFGGSGDDAIVFFPEPGTFAHWHDDTLEPLDWKVDGEVVSVGAAEIAVRREGSVWIVRPDGAVVDWIAETDGPVLLLPAGVIFATKDEIVLRRTGNEVRFALADAQSITAMGPLYVAIRTNDATYALRTEPGRESLFLLPGAAP
jgi:hypothetical protein